MTCKNPVKIWTRPYYPIEKPDETTLKNMNRVSFHKIDGWIEHKIPCGHCLGCRLDHANEWATRAFCEATLHNENCFITLTYNNENLPINDKNYKTLVLRDYQLFFKRLRKYIWEKEEKRIRYIICGEYGPKGGRPHYHALIFGWKPKDLEVFKQYTPKAGRHDIGYKSKTVQKIWGKGFIVVGDVTYESACYVARYVQKKAGIEKSNRIWITDRSGNKEIYPKGGKYYEWNQYFKHIQPEFIRASNRPGIAAGYWFSKKWLIKQERGITFGTSGKVMHKPLPRYFLKLWERENWNEFETARYKQKILSEKMQCQKYHCKPEEIEKHQEYEKQVIFERLEKSARYLHRDNIDPNAYD